MKLNLSGRWRWILIFWIFLVSAISYLDRVNISIAGWDRTLACVGTAGIPVAQKTA